MRSSLILLMGFWLALPITAVAASRTGYIAIDAETGMVLARSAADESFVPASALKLLTAVVALDRLGPDHRFETALATSGRVSEGVLNGDLVLRGGGDAELDLDDLMAMALALRAKGVRTVAGKFVVDDDAFLRLPQIHPDQPVEAPYNAGIGPLTLAFGRVELRPDGAGGHFANPPLIERSVAWALVTGNSPQRPLPLPVRDVGLHTAQTLARMLGQLGIDVPDPTRASPAAQPRLVHAVPSKRLRELVEDMLVYSNNQLAETIGLAVNAAIGSQPQSLAESIALMASDLQGRLPPADWSGFRAGNHSGLDPAARMTPLQLATILAYGLDTHRLPALLPANAWSGSLKKRMVERDHLQRVWAKTGSLDFAAVLAGYLARQDGGLVIFVMMSDDPQRRAAYDAMAVPSGEIKAEAQRWEDAIRSEHDARLRAWIAGEY